MDAELHKQLSLSIPDELIKQSADYWGIPFVVARNALFRSAATTLLDGEEAFLNEAAEHLSHSKESYAEVLKIQSKLAKEQEFLKAIE